MDHFGALRAFWLLVNNRPPTASQFMYQLLVGIGQQRLSEENFGSDEHLKKIFSHFNFIQKMLLELKITSSADYREESKRIYKYFVRNKVSWKIA